ncbi:MAG: hypothetical protein NC924_10580, partial [Candidatus Omnitrophica bacterium]|nr:hypothetical protein [Candidatus Omnitrophota bacterium]
LLSLLTFPVLSTVLLFIHVGIRPSLFSFVRSLQPQAINPLSIFGTNHLLFCKAPQVFSRYLHVSAVLQKTLALFT